jgi:hypothetical protein
MKFRLIRQAVVAAQVHGHIPIFQEFYVLQVQEHTPLCAEEDYNERWRTVPVVSWDSLSIEEQKQIEKELEQ